MNEIPTIPVIEHPNTRTGLMHCAGCDAPIDEKVLKFFAIRTSVSSRQTIALCIDCSETIAEFLTKAWQEE